MSYPKLYNPYDRQDKTFCSFIYFHGKLLDHVGEVTGELVADLVAADAEIEKGIHMFEVYGKTAIAYVWGISNSDGSELKKGLIVDATDAPSIEYAIENFERKAFII